MDPYLGEIRAVPFNFAPRGWAFCQGQLLPIAQNTALFSLLGLQYGGDGRSTFALPNLQGQIAIGFGQGPGLGQYAQGQAGGVSTVTLQTTQMPAHTHTLPASTTTAGGSGTPGPTVTLGGAGGRTQGNPFYVNATVQSANPATMSPSAAQPAGGGQPHNNMAPCLALNYVIALQGIFPQRA